MRLVWKHRAGTTLKLYIKIYTSTSSSSSSPVALHLSWNIIYFKLITNFRGGLYASGYNLNNDLLETEKISYFLFTVYCKSYSYQLLLFIFCFRINLILSLSYLTQVTQRMCVCFKDRLENWQISLMTNRIILSYRCMRLSNKTTPKSTILTESENVIGPSNAHNC